MRSPLTGFIARRLGLLVLALVVSSFIIFISLNLAPGDPLSALAGGRALSHTTVLALTREYHLDDPVLVRYWDYVKGVVLHLNLGTSIQYREPVSTLIGQRIAVTAELVAYAAVLIVVFGVGLGVAAGLRRGLLDNAVIAVSTLLAAVPSFVAAIVLIAIFAVDLHWLPALGSGSGFGGTIEHLTLPAIALAASAFAVVTRVTRVTVRAELGLEHVQTATSRGIPRSLVIRRHVLRNASIPITTVVGITVTSLFALSAVVEQAFNLNGIGAALIQAALEKDFGVVQGISLLLVAAFVVANATVDLLYAFLDPAGRRRRARVMSTGAAAITTGRFVFPRTRRRLAANRLVYGLCWLIVAIAVFFAIFGPLVRPHDPDSSMLQFQYVGPFQARGYLLGFDSQGRDLLSRLMVGARTSMLGPMLVVLMAMGAGTAISVVAAWFGGWVDAILGTVMDILFAFPGDPARGAHRGGLRGRAAGPDDRAGDRLHPLHSARPALGRGARAGPRVHRRRRGPGSVDLGDLRPAPDPQPRAAGRRPGDARVRVGDGRPGGDLVPRARRAAADRRLGRDGLHR